MLRETLRPVWAEINLNNIEHNINVVKEKVGTCEIIGVVKADGYGHGALEVAQVLINNGVSSLGVGTLSEAIILREAGITCSIIILGLTPWAYHAELIKYDLMPVMASYTDARVLSTLAVKAKKTMNILLAVETGMGRIGFMPTKRSITEITGINRLPNINIKGLFSHFATADEKNRDYANWQLDNFDNFYERLQKSNVSIDYRTIANSSGILNLPNSYYDAVRPGILLYGYYPSDLIDQSILEIKPSMTLKADIVFIKRVPAGYSISYGRNFTTERESVIATLPIGYADGYPRVLSKEGRVIVNGEYAPIVGSICMDQCMIDVTNISGVRKYDEVILMGSQGGKMISADEIADKTNTVKYEVLCRIGQRVPRVYIGK